jgi:cation:H+ antiporter
VRIAEVLGVPSIVLGLTVLAIGTSLPELVTAISSARQDVSDLAIGNLLGANIANLTLILGSAAAIHDVTLSRATQALNFPAMLAATVLVALAGISGRRVTRLEGGILVAVYALYLGVVVTLSLLGHA